MTGRNDPCPCGSGKKYKRCHGAESQSAPVSHEAARLATLKALDVELSDKLVRFARTRFGAGWLQGAVDVFLGGEGEVLSDAEMPLAVPWMLHMMPNGDDGRSVAAAWRQQYHARLTPDLRLLLDAHASSCISIWEVRDVEPGVGVRAADLLTHEERFIHDASSSSTLLRFDTLLAIVLDCDDVSFFGGVHAQPLPPREADAVVRDARRLCGVRTRAVSPDRLRDPDIQLELADMWSFAVDQMLVQPPPELHNTDGDPLVLTRDEFALVGAREEVARLLQTLDGAEEPELEGDDLVFVISKSGNAMHRSWDNTIVGRVVLSERALRVETNSTRRADSLRAAVERQLDALVRFRLRAEDNIEQMMEEMRSNPAPAKMPPHGDMPAEAAAIARELRQEHMRNWVDDSIPALGGLTPREAAKSKSGRRKLALLLKDIEHDEQALPPEERIDVGQLRERLGIAE